MSQTTKQILKDNFVDSEDTVWHTHVSMVQPRGKFQFGREAIDNFWDVYCEEMSSEDLPVVGIAEKPHNFAPVLVDVDIKLLDGDVEYGDHIYTMDQVKQVMEVYQSTLRKIVDGCEDSNLLCVLLEKPIYYINSNDKRYIKNGFHLHFPNLFLSTIDQTIHLIPRVKEAIKDMKVFESLGIEDSSSVIDECCGTVPWLLYGSRKNEEAEPYLFSKVFNSESVEIDLDTAFNDYLIYDANEDIIDIKGNIMYYLPRILSIIPFTRDTYDVKDGLATKRANVKPNRKKIDKRISLSSEESLKIAGELVPMIGDFRADDYHDWMGVGWTLYNIGDGGEEALSLWLEFSSRSEKYDESKCIYEWERMVRRDKTIGSLKHLAKIDSPELYEKYIKKEVDPIMKQSLNGSHNDIARVLHAYYGDEFKCASLAGKTWYQFCPARHRWEEIEEGIYLRERISSKLVRDYIDMAKGLMDEYGSAEDKAEEAMLNARRKQVDKLINNMKSAPFKNNVMKEAQEVFYDSEFKDKLDQNAYLIGFKNGVYDLKTNHFRPGQQDDYISKSVPVDYREFNEADNEIEDVKDFLVKIFPDSSIRNYFMDTYCEIFVGGNSQKKVYMWTGDGDNGKSIVQNFFDLMLGQIAIKFNTQYFTGKKAGNGSANPELSRAAPPVRHVTMEEPDADETLNIGELKKLSGGDTYWARDLFEKGKQTREVTPMFTLTFICNKLPKLKYSDKATWNRIRVIPFESTFIPPGGDCPVTFEEQLREKKFPMDRNFKEKIPGMVQAFAWYLLQWRQKMTVRIEPAKVKEATEIYRKQNDIYRQFIEECIVDEANSYLSIVEMYAQFKEWFKESFPNMQLPIKNEVKEYFENVWGESERGGRWHGYRIRTLDDDIESGDAIVLDESELVKYGNDGRVIPPL